ncbi:MAG: ADOP family duplicated permease [Vicinamibacterales bacterium]
MTRETRPRGHARTAAAPPPAPARAPGGTPGRPPRLATRLLAWRLHPDERDELIGDLQEQHARLAAARGPRRAARWYWRQTLALVWGFFLSRRDEVSTAHERRRGVWMLRGLAHDWRDATRGLRHSPGFALVALVTIAFGVGLSTAVFSLVHGVLLQPLPYQDGERLVRLSEVDPASPLSQLRTGRPGADESGGSLADTTIGEWTARTATLDAIVPVSTDGRNVRTPAGTEQITVATVGSRFFDALSVRATTGRALQEGDGAPGAPDVAVVSHRLVGRLAPTPAAAIGTTLLLDDVPYEIVGVSRPLDLPEPAVDVWIPGRWQWPAPGARRNLGLSLDTIGRMRPGVTVDAVRREGQEIATAIAATNPAFFDGTVPVPTVHVRRLLDDVVAPVRPALVVLGVGMAMVLLAACVSLANLVLTRTTARRRDVAVRLALGASRTRLARPVFFEQLVLAVAGSALGGALAWWVLRVLPSVAPADLPRLAEVHFDLWSLLAAASAAVMTAATAGLLPIWRVSDGRRGHAATSGLRGRADGAPTDRLRSALVVCQIGLAAALLVGAALVGRSLVALLRVDSGYQPAGVLTLQVSLPDLWWRQAGRQTAFVTELLARISSQPGVVAAGASSSLPMRGSVFSGTFWIAGRPRPSDPDERPAARNRVVTPGYLAAVGTPVRRGRGFTAADGPDGQPVVLVDELVAARYFPGEDAIGQRLQAIGRREWTIVGVVAGALDAGLSAPAAPTLYFPAAQVGEILGFNSTSGGLAVRTAGDPLSLVPFIREQARDLERDWPLFNIERLDARVASTVAQPRFYTLVLGLFAALALTTAVLGVYGVLAYAVERRRLEFSVRRALGAREAQILRLVFGRGLRLAGAGLLIGLGVAAAGSSLLRSQLFGVEPLDAGSFVAAASVLTAVVLLACWWPARRATAVDPVEALKAD